MAQLGQMGVQRLLLVTDPYFMENGTAKQLAALSGASETAFFDKVTPDPTVELAAEGTALVRSFRPDTVAALGGGSAMDCAKAMVYFADRPVRLVMVPTTSGSGSEVTDFAVLTHKGVKHPLVDEKLRPAAAILDSDLLRSLPKALIADTGFDVLSHALEAWVAKGATPFTDALAKDAFSAAFSLLPASYGGNVDVRLRVHQAATMAGMAFTQAGLGLCHAMAHALGGAFHLPHGRLNAILLPAVVSANADAAKEKYAAVARAAGIGSSADTMAVRSLRSGLIRLRRQLKMPQTLAQAGIDLTLLQRKKEQILQAALEDPCCKTNPAPVSRRLLEQVLDEVTGFA